MKIHATRPPVVLAAALALVLLQACGGSGDDSEPSGGGAGDGAPAPDSPMTTGTGADAGTGTVEEADAGDGNDADADAGQGTTASPPASSGDFAALAGLYDASYEEEGAIDVVYIEIAPDGTYTEYDYDGDDFDLGQNCYFIFSGQLESVGGDVYRLVGGGFDEADEGTLVRSGDVLRVSYVDEFDEDDDGDTTEIVTETWPVVVNLSSTDFNEC